MFPDAKSSGDFAPTLEEFFGSGAGPSAAQALDTPLDVLVARNSACLSCQRAQPALVTGIFVEVFST